MLKFVPASSDIFKEAFTSDPPDMTVTLVEEHGGGFVMVGGHTAFTERQLQYLDAPRRLIIVHATSGALTPTVTTFVDVTRAGGRR